MSEQLVPYQAPQAVSLMLYEPDTVIAQGTKAAQALMGVVEAKHLYHQIGAKKHLEYEAWQIIAAFYGCTAIIDWAKPIVDGNDANSILGYTSRASVSNAQGRIIASAEADCWANEPNWQGKPNFQIKSMSETRAASKALRMAFAWVAVLGGYSPTPAEEMLTEKQQERQAQREAPQGQDMRGNCPDCGSALKTGISQKTNSRYWRCEKCDKFVNNPVLVKQGDVVEGKAESAADKKLAALRKRWRGSDNEWLGFLRETLRETLSVPDGVEAVSWQELEEAEKNKVGVQLQVRMSGEAALD